MELVRLDPSSVFEVLAGKECSQAATMVLAPGTSTGGPDNRHPESDQWVYVISRERSAVVEGEEHAGSLLLIEAGTRDQKLTRECPEDPQLLRTGGLLGAAVRLAASA